MERPLAMILGKVDGMSILLGHPLLAGQLSNFSRLLELQEGNREGAQRAESSRKGPKSHIWPEQTQKANFNVNSFPVVT